MTDKHDFNRREFLRYLLALPAAGAALALSGCGAQRIPPPTAATASSVTPIIAAPTATASAAPTSTLTVAPPTATPVQTPAPAPTSTLTPLTPTGSKVLVAYFSRAGENYYYGERTNLEVGNTEVLTGVISGLIGCDVHRIEPVEPYPEDYEETVAQNVREQNADARPAIANPLTSIEGYDIVLLGSPIWNVRAPMIMSTFVEGLDWTGKAIFPFTTHAGSGLGTTVRDYGASCPGATLGEGLAVRGEEVRDARAAVESWLQRINLLS